MLCLSIDQSFKHGRLMILQNIEEVVNALRHAKAHCFCELASNSDSKNFGGLFECDLIVKILCTKKLLD